jgi:RNA polymerase sigma factor (sigma-70 family)
MSIRMPPSKLQFTGLPRRSPAAQALELNLVTRMDLLRLKAIARLYARGLPPEVGWSDLLQEAFARLLDGSRKCPAGLALTTFLGGVMRSLRAQHCRRARQLSARLPRASVEFDPGEACGEAYDPAPDPERNLAALQELARIERLFRDDQRARQIIQGLYEGCSPEEICRRYDLSKTEYDSTRRRMRRVLLREGLRSIDHED